VRHHPWGPLALLLGAGFGFLSLETAGLALLGAIGAGVLLHCRGAGWVPAGIVVFGFGYLAAVCYFAVATSGMLTGAAGPGLLAYWAAQLAMGVAIVAVGLTAGRRQTAPNL